MPETPDLDRRLQQLAHRLDELSQPTDAARAMERSIATVPRRRRWVLGGLTLATVSLVVAVLVSTLMDDDRPLRTIDDPTTTVDPTSSVPPTTNSGAQYEGVAYDALPARGIAVVEGDRLLLLDLAGEELGTATTPVTQTLGTAAGHAVAVTPGPVFELAQPDLATGTTRCGGEAGRGGLRVALCGDDLVQPTEITAFAPNGTERVLTGTVDPGDGVGHWRWALPSADGQLVLAQWSGECEHPTAFLVSADGGEPRPLTARDGADGEHWVASTALGWSPDGRAIVQFHEGLCGGAIGSPPGVYLVDPANGSRTLVHSIRDRASAFVWTKSSGIGNYPEWVFAQATTELGLSGCCGEPSHGGANATVGITWEGVDIPISAVPLVGEPGVPFNDTVQSSEPIEVLGAEATAGEADLGPFVSFSCGAYVWSLGGAGLGERATASQVRTLAETLLPHLYCTLGSRPAAPGHGVP